MLNAWWYCWIWYVCVLVVMWLGQGIVQLQCGDTKFQTTTWTYQWNRQFQMIRIESWNCNRETEQKKVTTQLSTLTYPISISIKDHEVLMCMILMDLLTGDKSPQKGRSWLFQVNPDWGGIITRLLLIEYLLPRKTNSLLLKLKRLEDKPFLLKWFLFRGHSFISGGYRDTYKHTC